MMRLLIIALCLCILLPTKMAIALAPHGIDENRLNTLRAAADAKASWATPRSDKWERLVKQITDPASSYTVRRRNLIALYQDSQVECLADCVAAESLPEDLRQDSMTYIHTVLMAGGGSR